MTLFGLKDIIEHFNYAYVCWAFFACLVSRAVSIIILAGVSTCCNIIITVYASVVTEMYAVEQLACAWCVRAVRLVQQSCFCGAKMSSSTRF
jgi:hypothetical protein